MVGGAGALFGQLKEELNTLEVEKIKVYDEIELLRKSVMAGK